MSEEATMAYEHILVDVEDGVAVITLNRPEKLNAMNRKLGRGAAPRGEAGGGRRWHRLHRDHRRGRAGILGGRRHPRAVVGRREVFGRRDGREARQQAPLRDQRVRASRRSA